MARGSRRAASKVQNYASFGGEDGGSDDEHVQPKQDSDDEFCGDEKDGNSDDDFEDDDFDAPEISESPKKSKKRKRASDSGEKTSKPAKVQKATTRKAPKRKTPEKPAKVESASKKTPKPSTPAVKSASTVSSKTAPRSTLSGSSRASAPSKKQRADGNDKKEKVKVIKNEAEAKGVLREYMRTQNVPHSSMSIATNMRGRISKPTITKLLGDLASANDANPNCMPDLIEKTYGKAKIYFWNQNLFRSDEMSSENLASLSKRVDSLREKEVSLKESIRTLQSRVNTLRGEMTDETLDAEIKRLGHETAEMSKRLESLGTAEPVSPEHCKKLRKKINEYQKTTNSRRNSALKVLDMIAEGMQMTREDVAKEMGLELDE